MANDNLVTQLLPILGRSLDAGFNVFDVMHHGTHEKQLSNVFAWLLKVGGSHNLEDLGQKLFVELINQSPKTTVALPVATYEVRQEVNTAAKGKKRDIADIALTSDFAAIVVENYYTSDGHEHGYSTYLEYGQRGGKDCVVVLLCAEEEGNRLIKGWGDATVVTYEGFLNRLVDVLKNDKKYRDDNPEQHGFISQLHRKYTKGKGNVSNKEAIDFVTAMCEAGEAERYRGNEEIAAREFAEALADQARERFTEGKAVLQKLKAHLRQYGEAVVRQRINDLKGEGGLDKLGNWNGIYQWSTVFNTSKGYLQIKFGPSAWYANEKDPDWKKAQRIDPEEADYSRLFLTLGTKVIRQSTVTLHEVLEGLSPTDTRLADELIDLLQSS